jgi:hypothetical protein
MSVESSTNSLSDLADQNRKVIDTYRSIARWVVSSFGAVAGALIVGVQVSSLGKLHGSHLHWALVSVAVLFVAILVVIGAAVRVLLPARLTYKGLATGREFKALRKALAREEPVRSTDVSQQLTQVVKGFDNVQASEGEAWEAHKGEQNEATRQKLEEAEKRTQEWDARVTEKVWRGRTLYAKRVFNQSMAIIFLAILVAAAAATKFAYLSSMPTEERPKPPPKVHVTVNEPKTCVDLYLALDKLADDEPHMGSHWPTRSLGAQDHACGFHNVKELARFLDFLSHR